MASERLYDENEVDAILKLAVTKSSTAGSMSRDQLLSAASELGISPEAVQAAELEYRQQATLKADRKAFRREMLDEMRSRLMRTLAVLVTFGCVAVFTNHVLNWSPFILVAMAFMVVPRLMRTWTRYSSEADFQAWRQKRMPKSAPPVWTEISSERQEALRELKDRA